MEQIPTTTNIKSIIRTPPPLPLPPPLPPLTEDQRPFQHRHHQPSPPPPPPPPVPPRPTTTIKMPTPQPLQLPQLPTNINSVTPNRTRTSTSRTNSPTLSPLPPPPKPPPRPRHRSHTITTSNNNNNHHNTRHQNTPFITPSSHSPSQPPPPPKPSLPPSKPTKPQPSNLNLKSERPAGPREWTPTNYFNSPTHRSAQSRDSHRLYFTPTTPQPIPSTSSASSQPRFSVPSDRLSNNKKRTSITNPLGIGFPSTSLLKNRSSTLAYDSDEDEFEPETSSNPDRTTFSSNLPYGSFPPPPPPPRSPSHRQLSRALSGSWLESPLKSDPKQFQYHLPPVVQSTIYDSPSRLLQDMPDPTFANRRPPSLNPPVSISVGSQFSSWALRGNWLCTGHHQFRLWHAGTGECLSQVNSIQDIKITSMEFKATASNDRPNSRDNRFVWCGTKDGQLFEFDCSERRIIDSRASLHSTAVVGLFRCKHGGMCSIDESAKVQIWLNPITKNTNSTGTTGSVRISGSARTQRIADKTNFVKMISHRLWTASGPSSSKTSSASAQRGPTIRVYDPDPSQPWTVTPRPISIPEAIIGGVMVGMVTAGAVVPSRPELIYLGHESGHVSVWETKPTRPVLPPKPPTTGPSPTDFGTPLRSKSELPDNEPIKFRKLIKLSNYQITAMEGVTKYLWVGFRTGKVYVYEAEIQSNNVRSASVIIDDSHTNGLTPNLPTRKSSFHQLHSPTSPVCSWKVLKVWRAHKEAVLKIIVDPSLLWDEVGKLHVATTSTDWKVKLWDGTMSVDWLANEMRKRQTEYCTYRPIKALICSWNVDACKPSDLSGTCDNLNFLEDVLKSSLGTDRPDGVPPDSIPPKPPSSKTHRFPLNSRKPLVPSSTPPSTGSTPDLIVFGFQEMIDLENKKLTAKTVLLGGRKKAAGNGGGGNTEKLSDSVSQVYRKWHDRLVATVRTFMPPDDPYVVIHTENLVGLFTCVFVKSSERAKMRDIAVTTVKTGMKGRYGNKGAILARLVIDDSSICFINCHLAAGQKHVRQRNSDLIDILEEKSGFPDPPERAAGASTSNSNNTAAGGSQHEMVEISNEVYVGGGNGSSISDHEICFIQGDLNYRIDAQREDVIRAIAAGEHWKLLEFDQLIKEKKWNPFFRLRAFNEPPIRFHPTYKYDPGTHMYDSSEKARVPAWCDRILYRTPTDETENGQENSPPTIYIQSESASMISSSTPSSPLPHVSHSKIVENLDYRRYEVNISDHRPISATFNVRVKAIVPGLKRRTKEIVIDKWAGYQNDIVSNSRSYYSSF